MRFPLLTTARGIHARRYALEPSQNYVRANALALPFSSGAFEFVLSVRLSHHIRDYEQRLQHLREILRVSRKWVMFTYFDAGSVKNRLHEFRRRFHGKRAKWTLTLEEVQMIGRAEGFEVIKWAWISRYFQATATCCCDEIDCDRIWGFGLRVSWQLNDRMRPPGRLLFAFSLVGLT